MAGEMGRMMYLYDPTALPWFALKGYAKPPARAHPPVLVGNQMKLAYLRIMAVTAESAFTQASQCPVETNNL